MAFDTNTKTLIKGAPFAYLIPIKSDDSGFVETAQGTKDIIGLNYIGDPTIKTIVPESTSSSSTEYLDITRADGALIRFAKSSAIIDGTTGNAFTEGATGGDSTGYGEITITTTVAPSSDTGCYSIDTFSTFIKYMQTHQTKKFLVAVATGFNYAGSVAATPTVDGWAYMVGKLSSDLEITPSGSTIASLSMTFVSNKTNTTMETAIEALTFPSLTYYKNGTDTASFAAPTVTDAADLKAGKVLITPTA